MNVDQWPITYIPNVFHVGTMQPKLKGTRFRESYEGSGLSVSEHPQAWKQIAQLGGFATWRLSKPDARFLDAHELTGQQREQIIQWGIDEGLITMRERWIAIYYGEDGEEYEMLLETRDEALTEVDGDSDLIRRTMSAQATPLLASRQGTQERSDAFDHLLVEASRMAGLDGVWWHDHLDPLAYSAPRGVIHPHQLASWNITQEPDRSRSARRPDLDVSIQRPVAAPSAQTDLDLS